MGAFYKRVDCRKFGQGSNTQPLFQNRLENLSSFEPSAGTDSSLNDWQLPPRANSFGRLLLLQDSQILCGNLDVEDAAHLRHLGRGLCSFSETLLR